MIFELRSYSFAPGDAVAYLRRFQAEGLPLVTAHLPMLGYWLTEAGDLNVLHHLWVYTDLADRAERRTRLAADGAWTAAFTPAVIVPLVRTQRSRLMTPVRGSEPLDRAVAHADRRREALAAEAAVLADAYATLTVAQRAPEPAAGEVGLWRIVAGRDLGRHVALHRFERPDTIAFAGGDQCDLMRPAAFSPL